MNEDVTVSTGNPILDEALQGGLPVNRTMLLTGTPGTGKSTFAMQFLQEGLDNDERCLFISTEQTTDELRDSFEPFTFDLDDENLTITTLHAMPVDLFEDRGEELFLQSLETGEDASNRPFGVPFTSEHIREYLEQYAPCDRVVLDSVSGLELMNDNDVVYRRNVLDMIRLFTDVFGATTLLTAEYTGRPQPTEGIEAVGIANAIQFNVHGVIRLWREIVAGDIHRFLDVMKMRGVNHDTRRFEIEFTENGVDIIPRRRYHSPKFIDHDSLSTGIEGLDTLSGGGLLKGSGTLLEHDGKANFDVLLSRILLNALDEEMALTLIPTVDMKRRRVGELLSEHPESVTELLDDGKLFVIDMIGAWDDSHEHVFDAQNEETTLQYILRLIEERNAFDSRFHLLNTEAKVHGIGEADARQFRYWLEANFIGPEDVQLDVHNPNLMADDLAAFYVDAAGQVLRTWMDESGLQYIKLKKSPIGSVGSTRLVEYLEDHPFARVQQ